MTLVAHDPRTGRPDHELAVPSSAELSALAAGLRAAQPAWEQCGLAGRQEALQQWRSTLQAATPDLVDALVRDTGRRSESELEVSLVIATVDRWCRVAGDLLDVSGRSPTSLPFVQVEAGVRPYPLVGVISPWNFPLLLATIDTVPALVAGCAVLTKPSEVTPRFVEPLMRTVRGVPGLSDVLAVVEGAGPTGAAMVELTDLICFTGSVPTGRAVGEAASRAFVPAFLELGGKDPAIVLAGADLERASSAVLWGGTVNAGQSCLSIERVYVDEQVAEPFLTLLVDKAAAVRLAWPEPTSGQLGPLIAPDQAAVIERHLADARGRGAVLHTGGELERHGGGRWLRPTVLTGVDHSMSVMTEETFGPVLPVMTFRDVEEAVRLANDSVYGLSAAVFGPEDQALAVARRLHAGTVSVNDAALTAVLQEAEKNSFGLSGMGASRMGPAALRRFTRRQAFLVRDGQGRDPWWFDPEGSD